MRLGGAFFGSILTNVFILAVPSLVAMWAFWLGLAGYPLAAQGEAHAVAGCLGGHRP